LRPEKDVRLRIDLLEGQSSSIARMLAKAMQDRNEEAVKHYSERLAFIKGRVEELTWVLGVEAGQSALEATVDLGGPVTVRELLEMLKAGKLSMDNLPADVQTVVRKGALEMNASKNPA
jgi:hypothetical protein